MAVKKGRGTLLFGFAIRCEQARVNRTLKVTSYDTLLDEKVNEILKLSFI